DKGHENQIKMWLNSLEKNEIIPIPFIESVNSSIASQFITVIAYAVEMNATMYLIDDPTHLNPLVLGSKLSDDYCDFTVVTTWHNSTLEIYDNNVLRTGPTSELLSPIRYPLMSTSGTHNLSVFIDGGTDSFWYNISYTVAEIIAFDLEEWWLSLHLGTENFMEGYVLTTWENATIYVYDNGTLMRTALEGAGGSSFYWWMSEEQGNHNIVLNITNGVDTITKTRSYFIPEWASGGMVGRFDIWNMQENGTSIYVESNWGNTTAYIYFDSVLVAIVTDDPGTASFDRASNIGTFNLTIVWDGGNQNYTRRGVMFTVTEAGTTYISGGLQIITYEGDTEEGDTHIGIPPEEFTKQLIAIVGLVFMSIFIGGVIMWWENRKEKMRDFRAAVSAGGH
ncbi:MAG: hypothetical protein KGD60_14010, partial [Candidatus Thorarchaeota archaeon]|nr:hypothetical protein [Candidatus Thorarchaeota archaeon]